MSAPSSNFVIFSTNWCIGFNIYIPYSQCPKRFTLQMCNSLLWAIYFSEAFLDLKIIIAVSLKQPELAGYWYCTFLYLKDLRKKWPNRVFGKLSRDHFTPKYKSVNQGNMAQEFCCCCFFCFFPMDCCLGSVLENKGSLLILFYFLKRIVQ